MADELTANHFVERMAALVPPATRQVFLRSVGAGGRTAKNGETAFGIRTGNIFDLEFLQANAARMQATTLTYAMEHLTPKERDRYRVLRAARRDGASKRTGRS